jgi:hypothetical protein
MMFPKTGFPSFMAGEVAPTNHAHFLFRSGETGIANVMRRLFTGDTRLID